MERLHTAQGNLPSDDSSLRLPAGQVRSTRSSRRPQRQHVLVPKTIGLASLDDFTEEPYTSRRRIDMNPPVSTSGPHVDHASSPPQLRSELPQSPLYYRHGYHDSWLPEQPVESLPRSIYSGPLESAYNQAPAYCYPPERLQVYGSNNHGRQASHGGMYPQMPYNRVDMNTVPINWPYTTSPSLTLPSNNHFPVANNHNVTANPYLDFMPPSQDVPSEDSLHSERFSAIDTEQRPQRIQVHTPSSAEPEEDEEAESVKQKSVSAKKLKPRGKIEQRNSRLYYWDPESEQWHDAVTHDSIRAELIASARPADGQGYTHEPAKGLGSNDETSFEPSQKEWGLDRAHRPSILFEFDPPNRAAQSKRLSSRPDWYMFDGKVVLDYFDIPVLNWPGMNATLSASCEPYRLEALFRIFTKKYKDFQQEDIRARMPKARLNVNKKGVQTWKDLKETGKCVSMPMQRFREKAGLRSWIARSSAGKDSEITRIQLERGLVNNSIRSCPDFNDLDRDAIKERSRGKCLKNAGSRRVDDQTRKTQRETELRRLNKFKESLQSDNAPLSNTATQKGPYTAEKCSQRDTAAREAESQTENFYRPPAIHTSLIQSPFDMHAHLQIPRFATPNPQAAATQIQQRPASRAKPSQSRKRKQPDTEETPSDLTTDGEVPVPAKRTRTAIANAAHRLHNNQSQATAPQQQCIDPRLLHKHT